MVLGYVGCIFVLEKITFVLEHRPRQPARIAEALQSLVSLEVFCDEFPSQQTLVGRGVAPAVLRSRGWSWPRCRGAHILINFAKQIPIGWTRHALAAQRAAHARSEGVHRVGLLVVWTTCWAQPNRELNLIEKIA